MPRTMKGPTQVKKHILVYIVTKSMLKEPMARNMKEAIEVKHHILLNIVTKNLLDPTKPGRMKKGYIRRKNEEENVPFKNRSNLSVLKPQGFLVRFS